ncbi:MAG: hypothetical protein ACTJG2_02935 [Candidatus Saccharimonadales bacterium]
MNNRKRIYITIGAVVLIVIIAVVAFVLIQQRKSGNEQTGEITQLVDENKHIGVVGVATKGKVTEAFSGLVKDISDPKQSGTLVADKNLDGESVQYTAKTVKNDHQITININVLAYTDKEALEKADPFAGTTDETIDDLGDEARYYLPRATAADQEVAVIVVKDATVYKFSLVQNHNDGIDITRTAAQQALVKLAKESTLAINK